MLSPFLVSPSKTLIPFSLPHSAIHPLLLPGLGIPLHWGIKPSQDQGPLLPLMIDKAILCCICGCSCGSLHVYSLVGGLVPGSSGSTGWFILLFLLWGCKPSAPCVLSLAPPLGTLCSVQWLTLSSPLCVCQVLAEPLRR